MNHQWFIKLHAHPDCTKFIHDVLDVVEKEMLIVLSQGRERSLSGPLRDKFRKMQDRCMDQNDHDYAIKPTPEEREFKKPVAVEAILDTVTEEAKQQTRKRLPEYDGPRQPSMRPEDLARMDELREGVGNVTINEREKGTDE